MAQPPPPPPFGVILPSRPVLTNPLTVSPTQYAFQLPASPPFSHVVVFLVPGPVLLPPNTLAAVYIQLPPPSRHGLRPEEDAAAAGFQLLGAIGNEKQSAVFRVNNNGNGNANGNAAADTGTYGQGDIAGDEMSDATTTTTTMATDGVGGADGVQVQQQQVTIGISVEPAAAVQAQLAALRSSSSLSLPSSSALVLANQRPSPVSTKVLAQRIIKNAFNFLASFAGQTTVGGEEMVPLRSFRAWWEKFERRVENDPGFLEREGDG